jgi:hypothetical protein
MVGGAAWSSHGHGGSEPGRRLDSSGPAIGCDDFITASLSECPAGQAPEWLEFTSRISDPDRRRKAREDLVADAVWHQAAVREWLESDSSLDETERDHLRARLEAAANSAR